MILTADELLSKIKAKLTKQHPYFGMLASRLKHEKKDDLDFYASNGVRFLYNEEFILKRSDDELMFILTNAVMHHVLAHQQRKLSRKGLLWQLATDYAINNLLHKNGLKIPIGANYNKDYKDMYAEEIYDLLKDELTVNGNDAYDEVAVRSLVDSKSSDSSDSDNNENDKFNMVEGIEENLDENEENEWRYAATLAKEVATRKSSMPNGLERLAKKIKSNNVDWRFELYNAINRHMRNNYAFMPPNKKYIYRGIALPSLTSDTLSLVVAIDTSGSIKDELLAMFIGEFKSIMNSFPSIKIEVIIADAKVQGHYTFQGGDKLDFPLKGGGGTDYRPVFEYIEANIPSSSMLLYFTDGEGIFPKIPPSYEVLWALSTKRYRIPFGRPLVLFDT